ncbi:MAG TPA: TIGR03435 family protein [Bryobacteraceae bacterium]|nr:TIGR03435 family protein [Bryobacteraceae bacterium]
MRWLAAFTSVLVLTVALAQSPAAPQREQFDVVSIKPSAPDEHNSFMLRARPDGLSALGTPLKMLIMQAYDVMAFQVSGGENWVASERWDLLAKVDGRKMSMKDLGPMLQAALADRFQLKVHTVTRKMPVFALKVDAKGSKLTAHAGSGRGFREAYGSLTAKNGAMPALATWLSQKLGRVVIDKTSLKGTYDFVLDWAPDIGEGGPESIGLPPGTLAPRPQKSGPSIFTALREQLGLRLVSAKGPVDILVIDNAAKPSEN